MLQRALAEVGGYRDENVLVGFETADDGGVYRLDAELALVQTVDFFTPIVDDPFVYGQIAAANALSDVYAMGGRPRTALSLVGFPEGDLDEKILADILRGGASKMEEAEVAILGGHSVKDPELKFGYAVTGLVHPERVLTNRGAQPGDVLLLSKPLGTGIVSTAVKFGRCPEKVAADATRWMLQLNRPLAEAAARRKVHAATDITGYGLAGHAFEMARASGVCLEFHYSRVPVLEGVAELAGQGNLPGGIESNRKFVGAAADWGDCPSRLREALLDPQTSGGLLLSMAPEEAKRFDADLDPETAAVVEVGRVTKREEAYLRFIRG